MITDNVNSNITPDLFSEEYYENFAGKHSWEPGWLADFRSVSWATLKENQNLNIKDEHWRFSPKNRFTFTNFENISESSNSIKLDRSSNSAECVLDTVDNLLLENPELIAEFTGNRGPNLGANESFHLTNTYFDITGGGCEDSINFIRTTGTINSLKVKNSPYDAVDMDFSNLNILKASIDNAGNDCFDVSAGSYKVKNLTLDTCHDKGVSVGERSQFFIEDAIVSSTNVAMAAKDSSTLWINSLTTNNTKGYCLEAYRKKQEFNGAEIFINKLKCKSSFRHDRLSKIEFVEESSLCNANYQFYDIAICVRKYDIKISQSKSSMSEIKLSDINFDGDVSSKIDLSSKCSKNSDCVVLLKKPSTPDTSHAVISFSDNGKKTFINKDITW